MLVIEAGEGRKKPIKQRKTINGDQNAIITKIVDKKYKYSVAVCMEPVNGIAC